MDVLLTHRPPAGVCDRTYQGIHAGSKALRLAVERRACAAHTIQSSLLRKSSLSLSLSCGGRVRSGRDEQAADDVLSFSPASEESVASERQRAGFGERGQARPPSVWVCGHIHEGAGGARLSLHRGELSEDQEPQLGRASVPGGVSHQRLRIPLVFESG